MEQNKPKPGSDPNGFMAALATYSGLHNFDRPDFPPTSFEWRAARLVKPGAGAAHVVALDPRFSAKDDPIWSHLFGRRGMERARKEGRLTPVAGWCPDALAEYGDGAFDLVVAQSSLHYLDRGMRRQAWLEIHRVLKPDGRLALALKSTDNAWMTTGFAQRQVSDDEFRWLCGDNVTRTFFTVHALQLEMRMRFSMRHSDVSVRKLVGYERHGEVSVWIEVVTGRREIVELVKNAAGAKQSSTPVEAPCTEQPVG